MILKKVFKPNFLFFKTSSSKTAAQHCRFGDRPAAMHTDFIPADRDDKP
jgi:hypothetical protein